MIPEINDLLKISQYYGGNTDYVIAGGGNTSFKDENTLWIKASGKPLASLDVDGLVALDRKKLQAISGKVYPDDPVIREEQIKADLYSSIIDKDQNLRPSVETSLHELIGYRFVVHLHPALINGVLCSRNARNLVNELFGEEVMFVPYTDPGYTLFKTLESRIISYREKYTTDPKIILLENHGSFVSADSAGEIKDIYQEIISAIKTVTEPLAEVRELPFNPVMYGALPSLRMMFSFVGLKVIRYRHNSLTAMFYQGEQDFHKISRPLTPDIIVYCKGRYLFVEHSGTTEKILDSVRMQLPRFIAEYGYLPKMIVIKNAGVFAIEDSAVAADTALDVFEDFMKVSHYSSSLGGIKALAPDQAEFIDKWEVENYRRKVATQSGGESRLKSKIAIITGGARGFGAGIAEALFRQQANVVIADLNENDGNNLVKGLHEKKQANKALFVKTDVSDPVSVKNLVDSAVREFGGIDIMISNAGILKAGALDEIEPEDFLQTTNINYSAYFYCAKFASEVMKIQNAEKPDYFSDIIQINSKSGLRGSKMNFAYSGSKFGSIGLTQSFALELAPFRIKVNAICPGNFYEGPLWSDPKNGLFIQYLKTGKVPGAKTVEDVRKHYEEQVPLKRGCRLEDVVRALLYIIEQEYETGQAVPVTGGQVMLS